MEIEEKPELKRITTYILREQWERLHLLAGEMIFSELIRDALQDYLARKEA